MLTPSKFMFPYGTRKLREIKSNGIEAMVYPRCYCMHHEVKIQFFTDCCIVSMRVSRGQFFQLDNTLPLYKTIFSYSKDMRTWHPYNNDFEPAEGWMKTVTYIDAQDIFPEKTEIKE